MVFSVNKIVGDLACCGFSIKEAVSTLPDTVDIDSDRWCDPTNNNAIVYRRVTALDDGSTSITWHNPDGTPNMTDSSNFTPNKADVAVLADIIYATVTDPADAEFGRVRETTRYRTANDGVVDTTSSQYLNQDEPPVDVTAIVSGAQYSRASAPVRVELTGEGLDITGAVELALAAIPTFATYAEIYIDASTDDTGIRWTKDGSVPADDNGEQEQKGSTIKMFDRDEIDGFRALTIDGSGTLDPALTASLTVNYWNVSPDED